MTEILTDIAAELAGIPPRFVGTPIDDLPYGLRRRLDEPPAPPAPQPGTIPAPAPPLSVAQLVARLDVVEARLAALEAAPGNSGNTPAPPTPGGKKP